jgi:tetratricopeptide (TPR) repeat protein
LWAAKFDERFSNIFEVHDRISEQLTQALAQHLTANDHTRLAKRYTTDPGAYEAYVTGLYFWSKRTKSGLTKAISYFRQAIEEDPLYALAYALLADSYYLSLFNRYEIVPTEVARANHLEAANKAMELDETLAEAHMVMASVKEAQGDYVKAGQEYRRVLELNPSHATTHLRYAFFLLGSLELDKSLRHMKLARELDPVSPTTNAALGYLLTLSRQYDEAIKHCRRALELDPEVVDGHLSLGEAYLQKGMYDEARAEFEKLPTAQRLMSMQAIAYTEARAGRRAVALRMLSELQNSREADRIPSYNLILFFTALEENDKAFALLDKLRLTRFTIAMLKFDPQLDPLRSDTRFTSYLKSRNLGHLISEK